MKNSNNPVHKLLVRLCLLPILCALLGANVITGSAFGGTGMSFYLQTYRTGIGQGYYYGCGQSLSTNALGLNDIPYGSYHLESPLSSVQNGFELFYSYDTNGFNFNGGGGNLYGNFDDFMNAVTNGNWKITVTNTTFTNVYTFRIASTLQSNALPIVQINYPADGSVGVSNNPAFTWQATAADWDYIYVQDNSVDNNDNEAYITSESIATNRTSWSPALVLPYGTNHFVVQYGNNKAPSYFTVSVPTDSASNTLSGWAGNTTVSLFSQNESRYRIDPPVFGHTGGHSLFAYYTFDNPDDLGHDSSANGISLNCGSGWGSNRQQVFLTNGFIGGGAVEFFGESSICAVNENLARWATNFAGSWSLSLWFNTTNQVGNPYDDLRSYAGQSLVYMNNEDGGVIPFGLSAYVGSTWTGNTNGGGYTLHTHQGIVYGNWIHVVVTRDSVSGRKQIYVDGVLSDEGYGATGLLNGSPTYGSLGGTIGSAFVGRIDDVQIYSGILNSNEVANLHTNLGAIIPDVTGSPASEAVAHWDFDEGQLFALDVTGNSNNIVNASSFSGNNPVLTNDTIAGTGAVYFDGGSYMTASSNLLGTFAGDFSLSLWLKTTDSSGTGGDYAFFGESVVSMDIPGLYNDLIPVALTGGNVAFNVGGNGGDNTIHSTSTVNDGVWHHVVVSRRQFTGERKIYVDGNLETDDTNGSAGLLSDPKLIVIGAKSDSSNPDPTSPDNNGVNGYQGLLDDVQVYPLVVSDPDVAFLYTHPGTTLGGTNVIITPPNFNDALNTVGLSWVTPKASNTNDVPWFIQSTNTVDGLAAASGAITNGQTSTITTTVSGPGSLGYSFNSIFNFGGDGLLYAGMELTIDGNHVRTEYNYYNSGNWQQVTNVFIPAGFHTVAWTVFENNFYASGPHTYFALDQITITNLHLPIITSTPNYYNSIVLGSDTNLTVTVDANPGATNQWYKNGVPIPGATNTVLAFTNIQFTNNGYYTFHTANSLGYADAGGFTINVFQFTDLRPLNFTMPAQAVANSMIPVIYTITNTGPGAVSNFYNGINFTNTVVTPYYSFTSLGNFYATNYMPPGTSVTISNYIRFQGAPAGNYTIRLDVDSFGNVIETNETNNSLLSQQFTVINTDLIPGAFQADSVTNIAGGTIHLGYNITNSGGDLVNVNFTDEIFISKVPYYDGTAQQFKQVGHNVSIADGGITTSSFPVIVPTLAAGDYYLILYVDYYGFQGTGNIYESNESNNIVSIPIHISEPDLVPTNFIAPSVLSSHSTFNAQWTIQNQGDSVATNWNTAYNYQWGDSFRLSTNTLINQSAIAVYNRGYYFDSDIIQWPAPLYPGQTVSTNISLTIPSVPEGNYYLILDVDSRNLIVEYNKTNNLFALPVTIVNPDLKPLAITAPSGASVQNTIALSWAVTNQGAGAAIPLPDPYYSIRAWYDRVYISSNSTLGAGAVLLGEFEQTNSVAAGTNYTFTNMVTIPSLAAGNYYFIVQVDSANGIIETNETNNVLSIPVTISTPELAAIGLIIPPILSSQQPFAAIYSVSNVSGITAQPSWIDRIYLTANGVVDTNSIAFNNGATADFSHSSPLPVGEKYTQLVNVNVPAVGAGDYTVVISADDNHFFNESTFGNNFFSQPLHILNPDLDITNFNAPSVAVVIQQNQSITVDFSVMNRGPGTAYVSWVDYLYISRTNRLDTNAIQIGGIRPDAVPLVPGASYSSTIHATIPFGLQGSYYLIMSANDSGELLESTRTNNTLVRPIEVTVPPYPVLSIAGITGQTDAWSGQQVQVSWVLTNSGSGILNGPFFDQVFLCSSPAGDNPVLYGQFPFTGQLAPGESILRQQLITLPISLQGTYWIKVQTDAGYQVFQFTNRPDETAIASQPLQVHLTPTPNLTIAGITSPSNLFSSDTTLISWVVTNSGVGPTRTPFWYDAVYLSASTNLNNPVYFAFLGWTGNSSFLNPGDSYANSLNVTIPLGLDGTYYFIIKADDGNQVFETNKTDNARASAPVVIHLTQPPDLRAASVIPPHSCFSGQPVSLRYSVTNYGLGQTMPSELNWSDRVYISTNNFLDQSAILIGNTAHTGGLAPGQGYSVSNTYTMPVGVFGQYYFIVTADIYNNVYEGAFNDNNASTAPFITTVNLTPPPDLEVAVTASPSSALSSHNMTVSYTVANSGATITPNTSWFDGLYISTNTTVRFRNPVNAGDF